MGVSRGYKRSSEKNLKVGDLVELSAYGCSISQNLRYHDRLGMIQRIKERNHAHIYIVAWFNVQRVTLMVYHTRQDLKHYKKR